MFLFQLMIIGAFSQTLEEAELKMFADQLNASTTPRVE